MRLVVMLTMRMMLSIESGADADLEMSMRKCREKMRQEKEIQAPVIFGSRVKPVGWPMVTKLESRNCSGHLHTMG